MDPRACDPSGIVAPGRSETMIRPSIRTPGLMRKRFAFECDTVQFRTSAADGD